MHVYVSYKSIYVVLVFAVHYNFTLLVLLLCLVWCLFTTSEITLFITFKLIFTHPYHDTLQLYVETCIIMSCLSVCISVFDRSVCLVDCTFVQSADIFCSFSPHLQQQQHIMCLWTSLTRGLANNNSSPTSISTLLHSYQQESRFFSIIFLIEINPRICVWQWIILTYIWQWISLSRFM